MRKGFLEELIKLQSIGHREEVTEAIDLAYRTMFTNSDTAHHIMTTLLMMLRHYSMLGLMLRHYSMLGFYAANDEEIEIIKKLCKYGRVRKTVRDAYISDFINLKNQIRCETRD